MASVLIVFFLAFVCFVLVVGILILTSGGSLCVPPTCPKCESNLKSRRFSFYGKWAECSSHGKFHLEKGFEYAQD
ncbi:MAG: hypothetical protein COV29_03445 [Candidatus Yanofskybacteria bacterium CG10_big_fil_rev_8_21_14_0_10_36_16]|uniref:Uncharacterized protein n=1 Tax=Candidatus Yanofskybacteria bacterium CG10_big_fil_rev_8_21_14_0_10_36_16 TaxID=1975096 RepID=A0A2J0Q731_9BACT|nr:MAG: hypothetical protein COV29_03445 [Candidatus Yanofskybacteria bacterium CG10_big_fil_rev_8_21_14_0_10_36_16]